MNATKKVSVFVIVFLSQIISRFVCGSIPVNDGAGWDGAGYLRLISILANGGSIAADPYHTIRLPGLAFGLALGYASFSPQAILFGQAVFNMVLISISAVLLYTAMIRLKVDARAAHISLVLYILAWPVLVIPSYYPLLTDHAAVFVGCLAIWSWAHRKDLLLWLLVPISFWVMPGVFLVPMALLAFKPQVALSPLSEGRHWITACRVLLTLVVVCVAARVGLPLLENIPDISISQHSSQLNGITSLIELRKLSTGMVILQFAFLAWIVCARLVGGEVWQSLRIRLALAGLVVAALGAYLVSFLVNWSSGYTGPPLVEFMSYQSLALPAKPLIAHFVGLTPAVILVLWGLLFRSTSAAQIGVSSAVIAFLPFILFGSESRQWIVVLPAIVTLFALQPWSALQRSLTLGAAIIIALPMFSLKRHVDKAYSAGTSLQGHDWQYYFSRQGPWMSLDSYQTGMVLVVVFVFLIAAVGSRRAPGASCDESSEGSRL